MLKCFLLPVGMCFVCVIYDVTELCNSEIYVSNRYVIKFLKVCLCGFHKFLPVYALEVSDSMACMCVSVGVKNVIMIGL